MHAANILWLSTKTGLDAVCDIKVRKALQQQSIQ